MRARVGIAFAFVAIGGCADILGIQDRYFDGGTSGDAQPNDTSTDPISDQSNDSPTDAPSDCGGCNGGICVLACHQDTPSAIATDGVNVYWTNAEITGGPNDAVSAVPVGGGKTTVLSTEANGRPRAIAVVGTYVYYALAESSQIKRVPTTGGGGTPAGSASLPIALAATSGVLVYADYGASGNVYTCPIPSSCTGFTIAGAETYVGGIATDGTSVYWSTAGAPGAVVKCGAFSSCGPAPTMLEPSENAPSAVAVDDTYVYWVAGTSGTSLYRADKSTGNNKTAIGSGSGILGIAVDNVHVYYAINGSGSGNGSVIRVDRTGANPANIATNRNGPSAVAVDSTHVYWTEWGNFSSDGSLATDGNVMSAPK